MQDRQLPSLRSEIRVDVSGAEIVHEQPQVETREIYLPKHEEYISHIALDIGGSLAKCVYFTRTNSLEHQQQQQAQQNQSQPSATAPSETAASSTSQDAPATRSAQQMAPPPPPSPNGFLGPTAISPSKSTAARPNDYISQPYANAAKGKHKRGSNLHTPNPAAAAAVPGGRLNFIKFETDHIDDCLSFIETLIQSSSASHNVSVQDMKRSVKIMATGGGAHLYHDKLTELGLKVQKEEEMGCLINGLTFLTEIPTEVFWYSNELVEAVSHPQYLQHAHTHRVTQPCSSASSSSSSSLGASLSPQQQQQQPKIVRTLSNDELPRPSPDPPRFSLVFDEHPKPEYPCMLVNIGSGVSIVKIDEEGQYERISGTSLGGGTLWGLLSLLTGAESFDEMLELSEKGDNSTVDMLVGDIYGADYGKIGLKSSTIASSFGKVFRKGQVKRDWKPEDISRSLLYAVSNNIGQIAYMNAEKHGLDRIYFGGCFIRGHAATMSTLSYAIRFWSKGTKTAMFLRHEGFLGAIGAWLKNIDGDPEQAAQQQQQQQQQEDQQQPL